MIYSALLGYAVVGNNHRISEGWDSKAYFLFMLCFSCGPCLVCLGLKTLCETLLFAWQKELRNGTMRRHLKLLLGSGSLTPLTLYWPKQSHGHTGLQGSRPWSPRTGTARKGGAWWGEGRKDYSTLCRTGTQAGQTLRKGSAAEPAMMLY